MRSVPLPDPALSNILLLNCLAAVADGDPKALRRCLGAGLLSLCLHGAWAGETPCHLQDVLQRAETSNLDLQSARHAVEASDADRLTARVTPPTQFSLLTQSIDPRHTGGDVWHKPFDTIARLDHVIERGDKPALRDAVAQAGQTASQSLLLDARRSLRLAATQAYWDLKLAQEQLSTQMHHAELAQESSRLAQLRLQQGDLSRLEATRLAVEADRAANDVGQARLHLSQARQQLAQLLHDGTPAADLQASDPWPDASASSPQPEDGDPEAWLASRPDVRAAQALLEQAQQAVVLAQAQRKADVTVSVQFEHNPVVADRLWGVGVAVPLGMDDRQQGPVRKALVLRDEAQTQLERVQQQALAERQANLAALQEARERLQRVNGQLLPQARQALTAAEYARQQGALGLQDVLDARRSLVAIELDGASAHADLARAWFTLHPLLLPTDTSP